MLGGTEQNQARTENFHSKEKSIKREIRRLQMDLIDVKQKRKKRRATRNVVREEVYATQQNETPDMIDVEELDAQEAESKRPVAWYDSDDFELPGWIVLGKYSEGGDFSLQGGYFIAINILRDQVILDRYESHHGFCESCDYGALHSDSGIDGVIGNVGSNRISVSDMVQRARLFIDPKMPLRRIRRDDVDYKPLACMYTVFDMYMREQCRGKLHHLRRPRWNCVSIDPRTYDLIVSVQAVVKGWLFRHKVLYNPQTELGHRYAMRGWYLLQDVDEIEMFYNKSKDLLETESSEKVRCVASFDQR